ncbi:hypothetical protein GIB67_006497 [Kingdonia uniflora]|uniref:SWIM-type domain-containing protein n=1 Tax=Kingdonia uniflora TaxID=39325 RepID=A0A7J7LER6_9MAGN|nr:hypothetical protein GIB67_006497 [Kingdonia uniflora]
MSLGYLPSSQNFISDLCSSGKRLSTTKDTSSGRGLSTTKAGGPLQHNSFPDPEPEYRGYSKTNGRGFDPRRFRLFMDDKNDSFEIIRTDVPPSNEPAEFRFEPQPEQVKDLLDFLFKSAAYTEDPYDFSKKFNIGDLYRDRIELKNHIRVYAVVNKFNLEHVMSNEYKIVVRCKGHKCSWLIYAISLVGSVMFRVSTYCFLHTCIRVETEGGNAYKAASSRWAASIIKQKQRKDPNYKPSRIIDDMQIHYNIDVTYNLAWCAKEKAHAEMRGSFQHAYQLLTSYFAEVRNPEIINVVPKVFLFAIHTFCAFHISNNIKTSLESTRIAFRMAAEALTSIDFDKHMNAIRNTDPVDLQYILGIPKETWSNLYIPMSRIDSVNIEDGTCSCRWWQTVGIPCDHGVRALGLANVDPTTRVSEYYTNNTYKVVYEPIWIPIRGI